MAQLITSQDYLNDEIVADKIARRDFDILVSPIFEIDGQKYRVLLDGHHSLAASLAAGADYTATEATATTCDTVALLSRGAIEDFLLATHMGADYRDAITGRDVW